MKKAKEFGKKGAGETFALGEKEAEIKLGKEEKIVLNIARSPEKIRLKKKIGVEKTGNIVLDTYRKVNDLVINLNRIKLQEKAVFFRLLSVMVEAGIPIVRSLNTLSEQNKKNPKFQRILADMAFRVEEGESLSGAMERYEKVFAQSEIGMVRSGEVSGHLNDILKQMAIEAEKNASTIGKVKGALTYPIVILVILFIVLFLMMVFVIPQISKLFEQTGADLPLITQIVIGASTFMRDNVLLILGSIIGIIALFLVWKNTKFGKFQWHSFILHVPIFGKLISKATLSRFSRSLANLLGSGVSIIQSLTIISNALNNEVYKRKIKLAGDDIRTGIPLAETLRNSKFFPTMLVNMIEIGEQTAQLESVTRRVADFYDEQVDRTVNNLTKIMEPIVMIFVGVVVGGLVAAVMLPIMSLATIAGGIT